MFISNVKCFMKLMRSGLCVFWGQKIASLNKKTSLIIRFTFLPLKPQYFTSAFYLAAFLVCLAIIYITSSLFSLIVSLFSLMACICHCSSEVWIYKTVSCTTLWTQGPPNYSLLLCFAEVLVFVYWLVT